MKLEVLWRQLAGTGAEHLVLSMDGEIRADSLAVGELESTSYRIHYQVECDAQWNVHHVHVEDLLGGKIVDLRRAENNRWSDGNGHALPELNGCSDVDIMITPFTNTLPIRRLNLNAGEAKEISAAYIGLLGLELSRLDQRYTCLSSSDNGGTYRYESLKSGFTAVLAVDTDGLVVEYPDVFEMDAKRPLENG